MVTNCVTKYSQENFNSSRDLMKSLRVRASAGAILQSSTAQASKAEGEYAHNRENRELELDCKGESDSYCERERECVKDLGKVHATIEPLLDSFAQQDRVSNQT